MDKNVLRKHTGYRNFCCPWHQHLLAGVAKWLEPGTLEWQNLHNFVSLTPETAEYLYTEYTPLEVKYKPGSRLTLEAIAGHQTVGAQSNAERAKRLCDYINRDVFRTAPNHWECPGGWSYYGGWDEEIIARRSKVCNDIARVFCSLCQVLGIPARVVYNMHVIAEAYVETGWAVFDFNFGLYYPQADGRLANSWDIRQDRSILERHPRYTSLPDMYKKTYHKVNAIVNSFVWEKHSEAQMKTWARRLQDFPKKNEAYLKKARKLPPCPVTGESAIV